ncbi:hypothetical protein C5167_008180 [Papaver somniferum]|uniref:Uncharacterized protein n=1 Tax=Papaver somniferum TaxID=3469 RepID=A0A4Y7JUU3_PAPSO|nr:hypothetical protein C5167_008180 [Papaver somniferum]
MARQENACNIKKTFLSFENQSFEESEQELELIKGDGGSSSGRKKKNHRGREEDNGAEDNQFNVEGDSGGYICDNTTGLKYSREFKT